MTTNVPAKQFFGTAQVVINTTTNIAAGNFTGAPALIFDNTSDAAVPYAPKAVATLFVNDWAAAPVAGTVMELWGVLQDVDSTSDDTDTPSGTSQGGARLFGQFYVAAVDAAQRRTITINMLGVLKVNFYLKNGTAQQATNATACTVKITPFALGVVV
jgi:hypothetical protein